MLTINVQVSIKFTSNRAITGSAIYADTLDYCSWYSFDPPYFYTNGSVLHWPNITYYEYVLYYLQIKLLLYFYSNNNVDAGYSEHDTSNWSLDLRTSASYSTVDTKTVRCCYYIDNFLVVHFRLQLILGKKFKYLYLMNIL